MLRIIVSGLLTLVLLFALALKFSSGYTADMLIPEWLFVVTMIVEAAIVVGLWTRFSRVSAATLLAVLLLSGVISLYQLTRGHAHVGCGCFGAWRPTIQGHLVLVSLLGICTLAVLMSHEPRSRTQSLDRPLGAVE